MIRNSSSFFLSFTIHAVIAMLMMVTYQQVSQKFAMQDQQRVCISLSSYTPSAANKPISKPTVHQPAPLKPVTKKEPLITEKVVTKPESKIIKEPVPVVEKKPAEPVKNVEPEPVIAKAEEPLVKPPQPAVKEPVQPLQNIVQSSDKMIEPTPAVSPEEAYMQQHLVLIAKLLQENLYYPRIARKRGITGEVVVAFELLQNGHANAITVSSGDRAILNQAAVTTIERLSGAFPKPDQPITLHVPIRYQLQ